VRVCPRQQYGRVGDYAGDHGEAGGSGSGV
jgi:hypothetical protein